MDEKYDSIVLSTGFVECVISGLLSVDGQKVLHMDRNDYYGGESASLTLEQLWSNFSKNGDPPASLGRSRDFNVDLIPKFIMAQGKLVKILLHCGTERYLEFKVVDGSYVYRAGDNSWTATLGGAKRAGQIFKVPVTESEALSTKLMGMFEKKRFRDFLVFVQEYEADNKATHKGFNMQKTTMREVFKHFNLSDSVVDFVGHALALYSDESFLDSPAGPCFERIALYADSLAQYGKSPYIYPLYGLGELPQAFARLAAIYGGTYMLKKPIKEIIVENNKFVGVRADDENGVEQVVKADRVVGDPSYFKDLGLVEKAGKVVRALCILSHPLADTKDAESCQIILPQNQVGRKHDIYVACVSFAHNVAPKGKYIAIVSSQVETDDPEFELKAGLDLLGKIDEKFASVTDLWKPKADLPEGVFISSSYDPTSHFETASGQILDLYKQITGKDLDLTPKEKEGEQA